MSFHTLKFEIFDPWCFHQWKLTSLPKNGDHPNFSLNFKKLWNNLNIRVPKHNFLLTERICETFNSFLNYSNFNITDCKNRKHWVFLYYNINQYLRWKNSIEYNIFNEFFQLRQFLITNYNEYYTWQWNIISDFYSFVWKKVCNFMSPIYDLWLIKM